MSSLHLAWRRSILLFVSFGLHCIRVFVHLELFMDRVSQITVFCLISSFRILSRILTASIVRSIVLWETQWRCLLYEWLFRVRMLLQAGCRYCSPSFLRLLGFLVYN